MQMKCWSADLPFPGVGRGRLHKKTFASTLVLPFLPGNMLDGFLDTSYVFPFFRRARHIHIQEHQSSALEPASLSRPMQGPSSVDLSGAKAGFGAGNLAATSKLPG